MWIWNPSLPCTEFPVSKPVFCKIEQKNAPNMFVLQALELRDDVIKKNESEIVHITCLVST